ncbi:hypothetical protein ACSVC9_02620 [Clostridium sp. LBM24168]
MSKKSFKIIMKDSEVCQKVEYLRNALLIKGCHLYERYKQFQNISIGEAAIKEVRNKEYGRDPKNRPAIAILEVILSRRTNYTGFVEPHIRKLEKDADLNTFNDLKRIVGTLSKESFLKYWNYHYEEKYNILKEMLISIDKLREKYKNISTDYELLNTWGKTVEIENIHKDIFGRIYGVGIATIQHLRMNFGIDTIKPDLRVGQVLKKQFLLNVSNKAHIIKYMEEISKITGYKMLELDQIFVNYGSGYYREDTNSDMGKNDVLKTNNNKLKFKDEKLDDKVTKHYLEGVSNSLTYLDFEQLNNNHIKNFEGTSLDILNYLLENTNRINNELMKEYNIDSIGNDILLKKRKYNEVNVNFNDNGIKRYGYKNIMTIWPTKAGVRLIITGKMKKECTFHSVYEVRKFGILNIIEWKLKVMYGVIKKDS